MKSAVLSVLVLVSCIILFPTSCADNCSSYWDDGGLRRDGRQCGGMYCCGTCSDKYCCAEKTQQLTQEEQDLCHDWPRFEKHTRPGILLGSILGAVIPIIFCVGLITCFVAPCCFLYKKCKKRPNSQQRQNVTSTFVAAPTQPASPPQHSPSHPGYQPVPVWAHYAGPAVPTAPVGPPSYMEAVPPPYSPGVVAPLPDEHLQPPYNPSYGFNP
ncbi:protein shisa-5-like [Syngnathoides biaculeatus]|uniref:protein shisa-5-like n=1 Tax=Syngnathoides biaculeatus TaxID=300417 RepID=UPI002ADDCB68|nr:protein shisa-5-like [Syngnathoides biaculeatus]